MTAPCAVCGAPTARREAAVPVCARHRCVRRVTAGLRAVRVGERSWLILQPTPKGHPQPQPQPRPATPATPAT